MASLLDGKKHFSMSEVNAWRASPGLFILQRYLMNKFAGNESTFRGNAVEDGFKLILHGRTKEIATEHALKSFWNNQQGVITPEAEKEAKQIPGMIEQCIAWKAPGPLLATQLKVEKDFPGLSFPFIGYIDFSFEPTDADLKTTTKIPRQGPRGDHARQIAFYRVARNKKGGLLYVSATDHLYYDLSDEETEKLVDEVLADALSLQTFLSKFKSPIDALQVLPLDRDSYKWSPEATAKVEELGLCRMPSF